jgi:lipoprotein-anchoring transpeptidase ErfK/SrfK
MRYRRALHVITIIVVAAGLVVLVTGWRANAQRDAPRYALRVSLPVPQLAPANPSNVSVDFGSGPIEYTAPSSTTPSAMPTVPTAPPSPASAPSTTVTSPAPTASSAVASATKTEVATFTSPIIQVYDQPGGARATEALYSVTEFGNPQVLPITQRGGDWLRVQLPTRPNGSEGWVRARGATITSVEDAVDVDLGARRLVWTHAGTVRLDVTTGIGAPSTPTPTGSFYVTDVLPSNPGGAYGAWVIALDAHSDAFTTFDGGDPRIAIHGTNAPATIGAAASNGCLHVDTASLATLAAALPLGTPVTIH